MNKFKRAVSLVLVFVLVATMCPVNNTEAAARVKLNKKKVTFKVGKRTTLILKGAKGRVKWKVSNKKVVKISKSKNRKLKIKGAKAGKAVVTAIYRGKKYKCRVVVKTKSSSASTSTTSPSSKSATTATPSATKASSTSSPKSTSSAKSGSTASPLVTLRPDGSTPEPTNTSGSVTTPNPADVVGTEAPAADAEYDKSLSGVIEANGDDISDGNVGDSGKDVLGNDDSTYGDIFGFTSSDTVSISNDDDGDIYYYVVPYSSLSGGGTKNLATVSELDSVMVSGSEYSGFKAYTGAFTLNGCEEGYIIYVKLVSSDGTGYNYISNVEVLSVAGGGSSSGDGDDNTIPAYSVPTNEGSSNSSLPSSASENTLQLGDGSGSHAVTLGDSVSSFTAALGTPVRIDTAVQGFKIYIYNPSGDYKNYMQIYVSNDTVIGMATVSKYFAFGNLVKSGDDSSTLKGNGFSGDLSSTASRGYKTTVSVGSESYNVIAYIDIKTGQTFGLQVYPTSYSNSVMFKNGSDYASTCTLSNGVYVNSGASYELAELVNAYRVFEGLSPLAIGTTNKTSAATHNYVNLVNTQFAQTGAEKMAASQSETPETQAEQEKRIFDGLEIAAGKYKEAYASQSSDPFDTLKVFAVDGGEGIDSILNSSAEAILCGFAYKNSTYFVIDLWWVG